MKTRATRRAVLVAPRDDNPYQRLLYDALSDLGWEVIYDDGPTTSQSVNVALMPLRLIWFRLRGLRILHLHWLFQFSIPWARRWNWSRDVMSAWLLLYLALIRILGIHLVFTAHDLRPHSQVFRDDVRSTEAVLRTASTVVALSKSTERAIGAAVSTPVRVVPFGSYGAMYRPSPRSRETIREQMGYKSDDFVVVLIGKLAPYKGAELLVDAAAHLPEDSCARILIAGACSGPYRTLLERVSGRVERVHLLLQYLSDNQLADLLTAADIAAFPFREITNSSSIVTANALGRVAVVPDHPLLADLSPDAVVRYSPESPGALGEVLLRLERLPRSEIEHMGRAARATTEGRNWIDVASEMADIYQRLIESLKR